ncbi:protein sel-1 homolog 3-like [Eublepharis macularius]|uniref:Protein sel-1 homolog 3-like n=1 Tax=Eublepharis macularius TaxID=481883 RepID=A0AA97J432_EUBMA|nr:protein sel-1 homolog 3-like [Eublepharis macularius]XP_054830649.1 protein sel-1 homolog 3-like [Eublepharis macularius]
MGSESPVDHTSFCLQGQGVKHDIPKALDLFNQAAEQGFLPALTALGWYYQVFENDYRRAVEFWEKADEMGDPVAPSNLGAFYAYGQYPGKGRDEEIQLTVRNLAVRATAPLADLLLGAGISHWEGMISIEGGVTRIEFAW